MPPLHALLTASLACVLTAQEPALVCAGASYGFGQLLQGAKVSHTFVLENRSPRPVRIVDVKSSCDCTTAPLPAQEVAPGAKVTLVVTFDTTRFEGPIEKSVAVLTEDPARPALLLSLRAFIVKPYRLEPAVLRFPAISRNAPLLLTLRLTTADGSPPPAVAAVVEGETAFEVSSRPVEGAREVLLELQPGAAAHAVKATLALTLNDPKRTRLEVPLTGTLTEDLAVFPEVLDLKTVARGADLGRRLQVLVHHPAVRILSVTSDRPWLKSTLAPRTATNPAGAPALSSSRGYTVSLSVDAEAPLGPQQAILTLKTTSPSQPLLTVPCTLAIQ